MYELERFFFVVHMFQHASIMKGCYSGYSIGQPFPSAMGPVVRLGEQHRVGTLIRKLHVEDLGTLLDRWQSYVSCLFGPIVFSLSLF